MFFEGILITEYLRKAGTHKKILRFNPVRFSERKIAVLESYLNINFDILISIKEKNTLVFYLQNSLLRKIRKITLFVNYIYIYIYIYINET